MKKILCVLLCAVSLFSQTACNFAQQFARRYEVAEKVAVSGLQKQALKWNGIAYTEYHDVAIWAGEKLPAGVKPGKQIAIAGRHEKVREIKGLNPDEWLITDFNDFMSHEYFIFKADTVVDIPPALALPSEAEDE